MVRFEKKHVRSFVVILSLAVLVVIGSTVAYFSSKDESSNRFVVGRFDITLTETRWDPDSGKDVVPGDELEKNRRLRTTKALTATSSSVLPFPAIRRWSIAMMVRRSGLPVQASQCTSLWSKTATTIWSIPPSQRRRRSIATGIWYRAIPSGMWPRRNMSMFIPIQTALP